MVRHCKIICAFLVVVSICLLSQRVLAADLSCREYDDKRTRRLVSLVKKAVAHVEAKGEAAFDDFSVRGSRWFTDDTYLYVNNLDATHMDVTVVCNGAFPDLVGKDMRNFHDLSGKPVPRLLMEQVTQYGRDYGWVHYLWPPPNEVEPRWKSAFAHRAVAPSGKEYVVAAGLFDLSMERCFAVQMVEDAAGLIRKEGRNAFDRIGSRTGPFVWQDTYVFVSTMDGVTLVNPGQPQFEGKDMSDYRDVNGVYVWKSMVAAARKREGGWVDYMWPKPGYTAASKKRAYLKLVKHKGKEYLVGCGVYVD